MDNIFGGLMMGGGGGRATADPAAARRAMVMRLMQMQQAAQLQQARLMQSAEHAQEAERMQRELLELRRGQEATAQTRAEQAGENVATGQARLREKAQQDLDTDRIKRLNALADLFYKEAQDKGYDAMWKMAKDIRDRYGAYFTVGPDGKPAENYDPRGPLGLAKQIAISLRGGSNGTPVDNPWQKFSMDPNNAKLLATLPAESRMPVLRAALAWAGSSDAPETWFDKFKQEHSDINTLLPLVRRYRDSESHYRRLGEILAGGAAGDIYGPHGFVNDTPFEEEDQGAPAKPAPLPKPGP